MRWTPEVFESAPRVPARSGRAAPARRPARRRRALTACGLVLALVGCGDDDSGAPADAGAADTVAPPARPAVDAGPIDKAMACATAFGDALTDSFGRLDGTVLAVVQPRDTQCAMPNDDHVVLQVLVHGQAYRMVINVESTRAGIDPRVSQALEYEPLVGPPWSEGWHTGVSLDYAADLGVHPGRFQPYGLEELSQRIADAVTLGDHVSVFATSSGGASAHLIHRNGGGRDGAIVLGADTGNPRWLLFHFADQTF